jgi:hypothetical protein
MEGGNHDRRTGFCKQFFRAEHEGALDPKLGLFTDEAGSIWVGVSIQNNL